MKIKQQPEKFTMVREPMGVNVNFWYTPPTFRAGGVDE